MLNRTTPSAIDPEKKTPITASSESVPRRLTAAMPRATATANSAPVASGWIPATMPIAIPPMAGPGGEQGRQDLDLWGVGAAGQGSALEGVL